MVNIDKVQEKILKIIAQVQPPEPDDSFTLSMLKTSFGVGHVGVVKLMDSLRVACRSQVNSITFSMVYQEKFSCDCMLQLKKIL